MTTLRNLREPRVRLSLVLVVCPLVLACGAQESAEPSTSLSSAGAPPTPVELPPAEPPQEQVELKEDAQGVVAELELTTRDARDALDGLKRVQIQVADDPFYHRKGGIFEGPLFQDVLGLMPGVLSLPQDQYKLRFTCLDGYQTTFSFASTQGVRGVVADRLQEDGELEEFPDRGRGKGAQSADPYYLVWEGEAYSASRPWPYQLVRIEIVSKAGYARGVAPPAESGVAEGYELFRVHCLPCHSINLNGGRMGPELNVPKNILEYRDEGQLKAFIAKPETFRSGSPMPPSSLSSAQIDQVLRYLEVMGRNKTCESTDDCSAYLKKMQNDDM